MADRRQRPSVGWQIADLLPLAMVWAVAIAAVAVAGLQRSVPVSELFLDPASVAGVPWWTGLLSQLGLLGWTVAAAAAGGGAWLAGRLGRHAAAVFLGSGALLTVLLLADDLLQVHAVLLPGIGIEKPLSQLLIVAPAPVWALTQRREILRTRWLVFVAAILGFAVSVAVDMWWVPTAGDANRTMIEDGAKFLGICAWAQYFTMTTADIARSVLAEVLEPQRATAPGPRDDGRHVDSSASAQRPVRTR
jgi:hypothetical protein